MTRVTVCIALAGYALGVYLILRRSRDAMARIAWTSGCIALIAHVLFAYHYYHHWSHASALAETARQTLEVYGWEWGGGLYINFALMGAWTADVAWWWLAGHERYRSRSRWLSGIWHFFLCFIFFNAAVVFVTGPLRWMWILFTAALVLLWLRANRMPALERQ